MKHAKDYMKKDLITFGPHDSIFDAAEVMYKERISGAPVVDGRDLVGIITVSDIIKFMAMKVSNSTLAGLEKQSTTLMLTLMIKDELEYVAKAKKVADTLVKDFMTKDPITVGPESTLVEVAQNMEDRKVDHMPVTDGNGKLLGMITRTDLLRALIENTRQ